MSKRCGLRVHASIRDDILSDFEIDEDATTDELMYRALVRDILAMTACSIKRRLRPPLFNWGSAMRWEDRQAKIKSVKKLGRLDYSLMVDAKIPLEQGRLVSDRHLRPRGR